MGQDSQNGGYERPQTADIRIIRQPSLSKINRKNKIKWYHNRILGQNKDTEIIMIEITARQFKKLYHEGKLKILKIISHQANTSVKY